MDENGFLGHPSALHLGLVESSEFLQTYGLFGSLELKSRLFQLDCLVIFINYFAKCQLHPLHSLVVKGMDDSLTTKLNTMDGSQANSGVNAGHYAPCYLR